MTAQLQMTLPSSWNVGSALPAYQMAQAYNDANQPTTTTLTAVGASYSFTQVYDPTTGSLQGLNNGSNNTANLAQLAYNEYAQLGSLTLLNGAASSPASLASETFNYDGDLRPNSLTASWLPGSGNSGQILANSRTYDNAGNVTSVSTTMAPVPGQSGSGGSEMQNFCYNEQNELLWAGNGGTQPSAGTGTCGSGTLNNSLSNAGYTNSFVYTNLGQTWQGPLNGKGNNVQYLYCNSNGPHHLTDIYPIGATCANESNYTAIATFTHGNWGDETSEVYNGVTTSFSYDALNHLVEWQGPNNASEQTVYDASGERVLTRAVSSTGTSLTVYAFGLQELTYTGSGTLNGQTDYYALAGHLIASSNGTNTTYYLSDPEGSLLTSLSSSAINGEQLYTPYGSTRYQVGSLGTAKAFTGQEADPLTGLYYYHARYYDPVIGQFLSPDNVQGNAQGDNPYEYVASNPETLTDPTGQIHSCGSQSDPGCGQSGGGSGSSGCHSGCTATTSTVDCGTGMEPSGSLCVYDSGACKGLTVNGCKAWKYDAEHDKTKGRNARLAWLKAKGYWELAIGAGILFLVALAKLAVAFKSRDDIRMLLAIIGVTTTAIGFMMNIGKAIGGEAFQILSALAATFNIVLGTARFLLGVITGAMWWLNGLVNAGIGTAEVTLEGPLAVVQDVVLGFLGKGVEALLKAGANYFTTAGLLDEADYQRQMDMPIDEWCMQYGGCPTPNPVSYN